MEGSQPPFSGATAFAQPQLLELAMSDFKARGIYGFDSLDNRSRCFNLIRSRLLARHRERGDRLFGVVSATPDVGKSFIATNVAASLSRDNLVHTTLVDLDLRRGSVSEIYGIEERGTLLEHLAGQPGHEQPAAYRFKGQALTVVPAKPAMVASAELLSSARAVSLFERFQQGASNELVIFDLPPAFANDDATIAVNHLDSYLLVAEEGTTKERELLDVVEVLGEEKLAGVIFNKYRGGVVSDGYGVDSYYGYGYGKDEDGED